MKFKITRRVIFIIINLITVLMKDIAILIFPIEAVVFVIWAFVNTYKNREIKREAIAPKNRLKIYMNKVPVADFKSIESMIYEQALGRNETIVSRTSIKRRIYYTIGLTFFLFIILNVYYCTDSLIAAVCFLAALYFYLLSKSSTVNEVVNRAKENPDDLITTAVSEDICSEDEIVKGRKQFVLAALTVPLAVMLFVGVNFETHYFTKDTSGGCFISSYRPGIFETTEAVIPEYIKDKKIVGVGRKVFSDNSHLEKVSMPDSVKIIDEYAFRNCTSLKTVQFSNNLDVIGSGAFSNCRQLCDIEIPSSLKELGKKAFYGCKRIDRVIIPKGINEIKENCFENCTCLSEIQIEGDLTAIRSGAFKKCTSLAQISLPDSLTILEGESFQACSGLLSIVIPEGVTEIRGNTFEYCSSLSNVVLHNGIVDIHAYAFRECSALQGITLPAAITEIHANTFENCSSLKSIIIPDGVTRIAAHAFYGCRNLSYVSVPDTVNEIGSSAFRLCKSLKEITLPEGVEINEKAFSESPTQIKRKDSFPDDVKAKIKKEFDELEIDAVYAVYDKSKDAKEFFSFENNNIISLFIDKKIKDDLAENLDIFALEGNKALVEYLKKAKESGFTTVKLSFYSNAASEYSGKRQLISVTFTQLFQTIYKFHQNWRL